MPAQYNALIAPFIDEVFYITSIFGEERPDGHGGIRYHKGLDIATPSALGYVDLFSVCNGTIIDIRAVDPRRWIWNLFYN